MGLGDYRKYKREQELKNSETISLLIKRIEELEKEVALLKQATEVPPVKIFTDAEKKAIKDIQDKKTKPEDFIEMFTGDLEEFNPNA